MGTIPVLETNSYSGLKLNWFIFMGMAKSELELYLQLMPTDEKQIRKLTELHAWFRIVIT